MNVMPIAIQANEKIEESEKMDRLHYLTGSSIDLCASILQRLLTDARSGKMGEKAQRNVAASISSRAFSCAVKELSLAFAYLMIFDNGARDMGDEKFEFVSATFTAIETLVVGTSVKEISLMNAHVLGYEMCDSIAESVSKLVGATGSPELRMVLAEFLRQSYSVRKNFLFDSLNLPIEAVRKAIKSSPIAKAA